jgi:DNA (cytosine-5)-methyltransferase 1
MLADALIIDSFAGGGGASLGIELALGRSPDVAINHDPEAIAMHSENHPGTRHYCESVWDVDPIAATDGRPVGLAWFSPDCKHFSKAKGSKPRDQKVRGLAWIAIRWAKAVRPRVLILENVEEFQDWGPLLADGTPCPVRKGLTFRRWVRQLQLAGYVVESRELRACDYGAPTIRKRLFVIARCDGEPIVWPEPTHGPGRLPYRIAAECIDWSLDCPSIFTRTRPLAANTLRRIARGIDRFILNADAPFIVPGSSPPMLPTLIQTGYGERPGQSPRVPGLDKPMGTIVAGGVKHALVAAFLAKHYGGNETPGSSLATPFGTVTCKDHHALVRAFLVSYFGASTGSPLTEPARTVTTRDRFGLVTVANDNQQIADIGMRMLAPRELFRAQGFPDRYRIDSAGGQALTKTAQVRMAGNSVCPPIAAALVSANCANENAARSAA